MIITAQFVLPDGPHIAAFNDWYSGKHVDDFLPSPGVVSGRRFVAREGDQLRFLAIYEHDGSCRPAETFASEPAQASIADFERSWQEWTGPPAIQVFQEIGVGGSYRGWPLPPGPRR